jgi:hypothetical protein
MSRGRKLPTTLYVNDPSASPEYLLQMALQGDFSKWNEQDRATVEAVPATDRAGFLRDRYNARLEACENELRELLVTVEPQNFLALCAAVGQQSLDAIGGSPLSHVHVEIAQFLVLKHARPGTTAEPSVALYSRLTQLIREYHFYAMLERSPAFRPEDSLDESLRRRLAYVTAEHFSSTRNWAYPRELEQLLVDLVEPLERRLEAKLGYSAGPIIRLWGRLRDRIFARLLAFEQLRNSIRGGHLSQVRADGFDERLCELGIGALTSTVREDDCIEHQQNAVTHQAASLYTFTLSELLGCTDGVEASALDEYLLDHTLEPGGLGAYNLDQALDDNPVWDRPLIRTANDAFLIPLPSLFHAFAFRHLELLYQRAGLATEYSDRRARFLEDKVASLFEEALPSATLFRNSRYQHECKDRENDLLIQAGNWLIVVEAKSHKINRAAQRGLHKSLKSKIHELMIEPSDQSAAFAAYLASHGGTLSLSRRKGPPNLVGTTDTVRILRLTVTLEPLGPVAAHPTILNDVGFTRSEYRCAVTMHVLDLAILLDALPSEEERLDYLFRRTDVQSQSLLNGEERDLLMFYIAGALRASWSRAELGDRLSIAGWRKHLDDAYLRPLEGRPATRYRRQYTPLWVRLIEAVRTSARQYWPEAATFLLTFTYDEQVRLEKQLRSNVRQPTNAVGRTVTAQGWGETFLVALKAVADADAGATLDKLRAHLAAELGNGRGDHALILLLRAGSLTPLDIVVLTNHHEPRWR